jgi:hypothetical protein
MFKVLEKGVELDVEERNAQLELSSGDFRVKFASEPGDERRFWVMRDSPASTVDFRCDPTKLKIRGQGVRIDAAITLSDDGKCRWIVADDPLDGWQLRKRALEALFAFRG